MSVQHSRCNKFNIITVKLSHFLSLLHLSPPSSSLSLSVYHPLSLFCLPYPLPLRISLSLPTLILSLSTPSLSLPFSLRLSLHSSFSLCFFFSPRRRYQEHSYSSVRPHCMKVKEPSASNLHISPMLICVAVTAGTIMCKKHRQSRVHSDRNTKSRNTITTQSSICARTTNSAC